MKTILGATALCLVMITAGATPAGAQDINISVSGDDRDLIAQLEHRVIVHLDEISNP